MPSIVNLSVESRIEAAMKKVLFVCIHNSARSQMAEAFINTYHAQHLIAESAGLEAGKLNPVVVEAMAELEIDISNNEAKTVDEILARGTEYDYVVTVCDEANAERCPTFPGPGHRIHWGFPDPSALSGNPGDKLQQTRIIRDAIAEQINQWCSEAFA